ncbi:MAG: TolC family protein [Deltaproteobacteria bacterium]|nr:MAG: TolC family protein [Deltaproteobacteria bacterium]
MKWFSLVLSLAVALVVRAAQAAEETTQVTLDEAVVLLRRQSPELLAGALKVRAAQGDVTTARLYPNPTLSFGAGNFPIGRTNPPGIGAGDTVNEQVGIGQELVLWGKRGERIAAAHGRMAAAGAERADLDRRLAFEVRARFVRTLVAGERLRLARENLTHYRETVRVSRERADAGEISAAEFDKIALEQRGFEHEVADAEVERRQAVAELLPLLGLDVADLVPVGELRLPAARTDTDTLVSEALRRRPDLTAAEREAEAAEAALRLARAERWPNVTVGVQYTHDEFQVAGNLANSLGANFSLPLPLVNRNQGEIQRAEAEALIARREVQKLRLGIPQEVRTAVTSYTVAGERVRRFEQAFLRQSEDARRAAEVSYREGAISLLEFVEAERTFIQTQRDHLDALLDGYTAAFDVTRAAALEAAP